MVLARKRRADLSFSCAEIKAFEIASAYRTRTRNPKRRQIVRTDPQHVRGIVNEHTQCRLRAKVARLEPGFIFRCAARYARDAAYRETADIERAVRRGRDAFWKGPIMRQINVSCVVRPRSGKSVE